VSVSKEEGGGMVGWGGRKGRYKEYTRWVGGQRSAKGLGDGESGRKTSTSEGGEEDSSPQDQGGGKKSRPSNGGREEFYRSAVGTGKKLTLKSPVQPTQTG